MRGTFGLRAIGAALGALAAVCLVGTAAEAQWIPPPVEYVATTAPVYYNGRAHYWFNNHWYWRDEHGAWQHYDVEPHELLLRRPHLEPRFRYEHRR